MRESLERVQERLADVGQKCSIDVTPGARGGRGSAAADSGAAEAEARQAHLFRIAGQMKLLVDTPEQVSGCSWPRSPGRFGRALIIPTDA